MTKRDDKWDMRIDPDGIILTSAGGIVLTATFLAGFMAGILCGAMFL